METTSNHQKIEKKRNIFCQDRNGLKEVISAYFFGKQKQKECMYVNRINMFKKNNPRNGLVKNIKDTPSLHVRANSSPHICYWEPKAYFHNELPSYLHFNTVF